MYDEFYEDIYMEGYYDALNELEESFRSNLIDNTAKFGDMSYGKVRSSITNSKIGKKIGDERINNITRKASKQTDKLSDYLSEKNIKKHEKRTGREVNPKLRERYMNARRNKTKRVVQGAGAIAGAGAIIPGPVNPAMVGVIGKSVIDTKKEKNNKKTKKVKAFAEGYYDALVYLESTVARGYNQKPGNLMNPNKKAFAQRNNEMSSVDSPTNKNKGIDSNVK